MMPLHYDISIRFHSIPVDHYVRYSVTPEYSLSDLVTSSFKKVLFKGYVDKVLILLYDKHSGLLDQLHVC